VNQRRATSRSACSDRDPGAAGRRPSVAHYIDTWPGSPQRELADLAADGIIETNHASKLGQLFDPSPHLPNVPRSVRRRARRALDATGRRSRLPFRTRDDPADVYSIDTPPPTVSGCCTSATSSASPKPTSWPVLAYARKNVFYPMAGMTTACRPSARGELLRRSLRPVPALRRLVHSPTKAPEKKVSISRRTSSSSATCSPGSTRGLQDHLALPGSEHRWSLEYSTISSSTQAISQRVLEMLSRGEVYSEEAPTLWTSTFARRLQPIETATTRQLPPRGLREVGRGAIEIETPA